MHREGFLLLRAEAYTHSSHTCPDELSWCWVSYKNDQNPVGVLEKGKKAVALFKEAREKNSRAVSKKLIEDLEKSLN